MILTAVFAVVVLAVGLAHRQLSRTRAAWPGAVVPALFLVGAVFLFSQGHIDSVFDYLVVAIGLVALLRLWDEGRQVRTEHVGAA